MFSRHFSFAPSTLLYFSGLKTLKSSKIPWQKHVDVLNDKMFLEPFKLVNDFVKISKKSNDSSGYSMDKSSIVNECCEVFLVKSEAIKKANNNDFILN